MKVLQNFAVIAAVIFVGACSTAPSAEESAFLDAVKFKAVVADDDGLEFAKFDSDGSALRFNNRPDVPFEFKSASSALTGVYELAANDITVGRVTIKLNADKVSGTLTVEDLIATPTTTETTAITLE